MNLLEKIELLINATTRSKLPRRRRHSVLDEHEEKLLAESRQAVAEVEAKERGLAERIKVERDQAEVAAQQGDRANERAHRRRAAEVERHLEQESIQAIDLEEKLAALEEKLAQAQEAVDKKAQEAARRDEQASLAMGQAAPTQGAESEQAEEPRPRDLDSRKSRLGD